MDIKFISWILLGLFEATPLKIGIIQSKMDGRKYEQAVINYYDSQVLTDVDIAIIHDYEAHKTENEEGFTTCTQFNALDRWECQHKFAERRKKFQVFCVCKLTSVKSVSISDPVLFMGAKKPADKTNSEAPRKVTKKAGYHMEVTVTKPGENGDETYNFNIGSFHVDTKVKIVKEMLATDTTANAKSFWQESDKTCKPAIVFGDFNTRAIASDVIYDEAIGDIIQQGDRVWPIKEQTVQCCKKKKSCKNYNELDMNLLFDRLKDSRVRDVTFRKMIGRSQLFQNGAYQESGEETTCNLHPQFNLNDEPKPCYHNQNSPYGTISDLFFTNVHWWLQNPNKQIPWFTYKRMCETCHKIDDDTERTDRQKIASLNTQWSNNAPENELAAPDGLIASFTNGFQEVGATIKKCTSKRRIVKDKDVDTKVLNLGWLDLFGLYDPTRTIPGRNPLPASCTSRDTVEFLDVRTLTEVIVFDHVPTYAQIQLTLGEQFSEVSAEVSQTEYVTYDRLILLATFLSLIGVSLTLKCKKTSTDGLYSKLITEEEV